MTICAALCVQGVLATYDIRRPNCQFISSTVRLFTSDTFIERGLGSVLIFADRNTVTPKPPSPLSKEHLKKLLAQSLHHDTYDS
jgi:hypothetical protein